MKVAVLIFTALILSFPAFADKAVGGGAGAGGDAASPQSDATYSSQAAKCGAIEANYTPDKKTGHQANEAVTEMVKCMAKSMHKDDCAADCSDGFVSCDETKMNACGYTKVTADTSSSFGSLCNTQGTIRAYKTGAKEWKSKGHAEMVCGTKGDKTLYCSINNKPIDGPAADPPDACWVPSADGKLAKSLKAPKDKTPAGGDAAPAQPKVTVVQEPPSTPVAPAAPIAAAAPVQNYNSGGGGGGGGGVGALMGPAMAFASYEAQQNQQPVGRVIWFNNRSYYNGAYNPYALGGGVYGAGVGQQGFFAANGQFIPTVAPPAPLYLTNGALVYPTSTTVLNQVRTTTSQTVRVGR